MHIITAPNFMIARNNIFQPSSDGSCHLTQIVLLRSPSVGNCSFKTLWIWIWGISLGGNYAWRDMHGVIDLLRSI